MLSTSTKYIARRATETRQRLRRTADDCCILLKDAMESRDTSLMGVSDRVVPELLRNMGLGLFDAATLWLPPGLRSFSFYFWPGYNTVLRSPARVALTANIPGIGDIDCGIGVQSRAGTRHEYLICPASFWYSKVLVPFGAFQPGGTHPWITQADTADNPLEILCVKKHHVSKGVLHGDHSCIVSLRGSPTLWGDTIARKLQKRWPNTPWPTVSDEHGRPPAAANALDGLRIKLYNIWLGSVLLGEIGERARLFDQIDKLLTTDEDLIRLGTPGQPIHGLAEHVHKSVGESKCLSIVPDYKPVSFNLWYTFPIKEPLPLDIGAERRRELGSAMMLSSEPLHVTYLHIAASWVVSMYQAIRDIENRIKNREAGKSDMLGAFSHEVGKLGGSVLNIYSRPLRDVFGGSLGIPHDTYGWETRPFAITVPRKHRRFISNWRLATVPALYKGLEDMLAVWSGSRDTADWFGISDEIVTVKALIKALAASARSVAAARHMIGETPPRSLEDAIKLDAEFDSYARDRATFASPAGNGSDLEVLADTQTQRIMRGHFVRLLAALMSNAVRHAEDHSTIAVSITYNEVAPKEQGALTLLFRNVAKEKGSAKEKPSEFSVSTEGVALYCLSALGGTLESFPKTGETDAITQALIPRTTSYEGQSVTWLHLP